MPRKNELSPYALKLGVIQGLLYKDVLQAVEPSQLSMLDLFFPAMVIHVVPAGLEMYNIGTRYLEVSRSKNGLTCGENLQIAEICGSLFGKSSPKGYKQITATEEIQTRIAQDMVEKQDNITKTKDALQKLTSSFSVDQQFLFNSVFTAYIDSLSANGNAVNEQDHPRFRISSYSYAELISRIKAQWDSNNAESKINAIAWLFIGAVLASKTEPVLDAYNAALQKKTNLNKDDRRVSGEKYFSSAMRLLDTPCDDSSHIEAVYLLNKAVDLGNLDALVSLGNCYEIGRGVAKSTDKAVNLYNKAAKNGDAQAEYRLGICYYKGKGVSVNYKNAIEWLTKALDHGVSEALVPLSKAYKKYGDTVNGAAQKSECYKKSAELGNVAAQYLIGKNYLTGYGVCANSEQAEYWLKKSSSQGNSDAQLFLAECYEKGKFKDIDLEKAAYWYEKAADNGRSDAQYIIGKYYANGTGVVQDWGAAVKWYEKSAEQNNSDAECALGLCYADGNGVEQNDHRAAELFKRAADKNNVEAIFQLGVCYDFGIGVCHFEEDAVECYERAAKMGHAKAMAYLALCFLGGEFYWEIEHREDGVCWLKKSYASGYNPAAIYLAHDYIDKWHTYHHNETTRANRLKWAHIAADLNDAKSQFWLGSSYFEGRNGVNRDWDNSKHFLEISLTDRSKSGLVENDRNKAKEMLDTIEQRTPLLTDEERDRCYPSHRNGM